MILSTLISIPGYAENENFSLYFFDKQYEFNKLYLNKDNSLIPVTTELIKTDGDDIRDFLKNVYIELDDSDLKAFFNALGAFPTWSTSKETLLVYSSGRNIFFDSTSSWFNYRSQEKRSGKGYIKKDNKTFLPFDDLLSLMKISFQNMKKQNSFRCIPIIDDLLWKEDFGTREFLIHATTPLKYNVESENEGQITLLFPEAESAFKDGDVYISDACVKIDEKTESDSSSKGKRITIIYPEYWKGRLTERRLTGDIVIEMLPEFPLTSGYRYENTTRIESKSEKKSFTIDIEATGPMQYLWKYIPESKLLIVDIPLLEIPADFKKINLKSEYFNDARVFSLNKLYGDTRLYFTLNEKTSFSFETNKISPYVLSIKFSQTGTISSDYGKGFTGQPENWGTIAIDPGHGGGDPGAVNNSLGAIEKNINLDICLRLSAILRKNGWKVVMTRITDRDVSWENSPDKVELQARVDVANVNSASIFVSIHCNASTDRGIRGSSLHWCKEEDFPLAESMVITTKILEEALGIPQRGIINNKFYVLNHSKMPSILVETAHLSNIDEAGILSDALARQKIAEAIAKGIEKYFLEKGFIKKSNEKQ